MLAENDGSPTTEGENDNRVFSSVSSSADISTDDSSYPGGASILPLVESAADETEGDSVDLTQTKWSTLLLSPADPSFSPSLPIGKSLHGLALTVTVERMKTLTK